MEVSFYCYSCLFQLLDEVQSYILVERSIEDNNAAIDSTALEFIQIVSSSIPLAIPFIYNTVVISCFIVYTMVICWLFRKNSLMANRYKTLQLCSIFLMFIF